MIQSVITTPLTLTSNSSAVAFQNDTLRGRNATCCGWLSHGQGSPLYKITKGGVYEIEFTGTVTSATAGIVALGVYNDGILLPCSISAETLAAAGDLANITTRNTIRVCCNDNSTLTIGSVPSVLAGATLVATDTQIPIITSANVTITRIG